MSYYTALQLAKEPFSNSPDPDFFYRSSEHQTVLNRLEIAIRLKRGLNLVLGDVGTGKTTLSRALFQAFSGEDDYVFHMILDPDFKSEYEFLSHLTKLFEVSPFFRDSVDHRDAIEKYLFQKAAEEQKTIVLVIDEGQKLTLPVLEILRTLLNYETNEQKLLQLVILGQMELFPKIKDIANFMDRVNFKYILQPLDEYETGKMIHFRLSRAGHETPESLFTREAVHAIYDHTQGYPRQIARFCHNAMEQLVMRGRQVVTQDVIEHLILLDRQWR